MRRLGILGGMAWPSTADLYRRINQGVAARLGGAHSAPLIIWSVDFAEIEACQAAGDWDAAGRLLADAARRLEAAGAEGLLLATNTMHRVAEAIEAATSLPLLHLADVTAARIRGDDVHRVGLLGTRFTMEQAFYRGRLAAHHLDVLVPDEPGRAEVHRMIYDELIHGQVREDSRAALLGIIDGLVARGAHGIIAGCTELELLLTADDVEVAWYPTTALHAEAAVEFVLGADPALGPGATGRRGRLP